MRVVHAVMLMVLLLMLLLLLLLLLQCKRVWNRDHNASWNILRCVQYRAAHPAPGQRLQRPVGLQHSHDQQPMDVG
jgi:hypothetical protein